MRLQSVLFIVLVALFCSCENISTYPITAPSAEMEDGRIIGKWKFEEDSNSNNFYEVTEGYYPHEYHVKFWDRGGTNPTYEANTHFSKIADVRFINVPYFENNPDRKGAGGLFRNEGYMFLRILDENDDFSKIIAAVVGDETMRKWENSEQVHDYVMQNMDKKIFYSDTIHLYKFQQ